MARIPPLSAIIAVVDGCSSHLPVRLPARCAQAGVRTQTGKYTLFPTHVLQGHYPELNSHAGGIEGQRLRGYRENVERV